MDISTYKKGTFLFVSKELDMLPSYLKPGEVLNQIVNGQMNARSGILVLTDSRVFWLAKRMFGGVDFAEASLSRIGGASVKKDGISNKLEISYSGGTMEVSVSESKVAADFAAAISAPSPVIAAAPHGDDLLNKLERLAALKSAGVLTDDEFAQQKAKILS